MRCVDKEILKNRRFLEALFFSFCQKKYVIYSD